MTTNTDTIRRLAEMNDVAAFERIASAVLRAAAPFLYAKLLHPGVQPGGKTVKAPFDNIGWVQSAEGLRFVCAAHTTEQKDLLGKWLHDPTTVKPRKAGVRSTKPAGDLVKGAEKIQELRNTRPELAVTFALTTNRETSFELLVLIEAWAHAADIELDVWSVSRIAHFLDTDPTGQIIRRIHLDIPVKLLSRELLLEMGRCSIRDHLPLSIAGENISRDGFFLGHGDTMVVGAPGMGKTTACAMALDAYIKRGLPAVVLKTEFLVTAATMEVAIEGELLRQEPELEGGAGAKALSFCSSGEPMLVLLEDINRADNPSLLLNKVLSWTLASSGDHVSERLWRAVCPIWPQYLDVIENQERVLAAVTIVQIDRYNPAEAIRAVRRRADLLGLPMDEHRAMSIADRLGQDPLLIDLHDLTSEGTAAGVIQSYIEERLGIVANQAQHAKSEVVQVLHQLMRNMLQHRNLGPRWVEAKSWIADRDVIALLRRIAREGSVIRISDVTAEERLKFRHDRVMHNLFSGALAEVLKMDAPPDCVTDPFFAEVVAGAAVQVELPLQQLMDLMDATPVVVAHSLRLASELHSSYTEIAAQALSQWLQRRDVQEVGFASRRYAVALVLAETTDKSVRQLVVKFPASDRPWYPLLAAAFRNGDVGAGLSLLSIYEIGVTVAGKQSLLSLVKRMYGHNLVADVDTVLRRVDLSHFGQAGMRVGALRLAGYLGDSSLSQAVRVCWDQDVGSDKNLRSYLFAAARCCGDAPEMTLGPVCDAWESLPQEPDSPIGQPAERLAADNVAWEFRTYPPRNAVSYLVERANASEKIKWPITYMLRTVDHPDAVEQLARYAAGSHYITADQLRSDWKRHSEEAGRRMSSESRERLLGISLDEAESDSVRKQAFELWEVSIDDADIEFLRQVPKESPLYERALWMRARRQDISVIPEVLKNIPENPVYWLHIGHYLWSDALTEMLDLLLDQLAEEQIEANSNLEYAIADALGHVEPRRAVDMLRSRWEILKTKPLMVQAMLLSKIPEAASLAREAITTSSNPGALLKHFVSNSTVISMSGKQKLSDPAQLHNLRSYLDIFSDEDFGWLWDTCTRKGWLNFRTQYLDPQMRKIPNRRAILPDDRVDTKYLDRALASKNGEKINLYHWLGSSADSGMPRDKVVGEMLDWLERHVEVLALVIVSGIVSREGTREEFLLYEAVAVKRADSTDIVKAVRFDVFSRSLV